ncbi:MAG: peptide deformylase [bacterium]|nr:peptide deformylase [bacterium]
MNDIKYLRQASSIVDFRDSNLLFDISKVKKYMEDSSSFLAISPVQIGILKRFICINKKANCFSYSDIPLLLINPVVVSMKGLTIYGEECGSIKGYIAYVKRPYKILINYLNINEEKLSYEFVGILAGVISHEIDHLNGILTIDVASNFKLISEIDKKVNKYIIVSKDGEFNELSLEN